jgi:hypothetical protein
MPADSVSITSVTVKVADRNNNLVNTSTYVVRIVVTGEGTVINPDQYNNYETVNGIVTLLVRSTSKTGVITIEAGKAGLQTGYATIATVSSEAVKIMLIANDTDIIANGIDSILITAMILDANNNLVTTSTAAVTFSVFTGNKQRQDFVPVEVISSSGIAEFIYSDETGGIMIVKAGSAGMPDAMLPIINYLDKSKGGYHLFSDTSVVIFVPPWTIDSDMKIELNSAMMSLPAGIDSTGITILSYAIKEFLLKDNNNNNVSTEFNRAITMTISYRDDNDDGYEDVTGIKVDNLKLFFVADTGNGTSKLEWVRTAHVDKLTKTVVAQVSHFTVFALGAFSDLQNVLYQNYPNPFIPSRDGTTRIEYSVAETGAVSIKIYNIVGELVKTLLDENVLTGTKSYVEWDGKNSNNEYVADGVYLCNIKTPGYTKTIKVLLIK